jgi:hypothetical protein
MTTPLKQKIQNLKPAGDEVVPAFLRKSFEILEDEKYADIVCWSDDGSSLIIKNPLEFSQRILPQYFKHNNLTSFVRQLNMYDFHKRKNALYEHVFSHELFQRGKKDLLKDIKRKNSDCPNTGVKLKVASDNEKNATDIYRLFNENLYLRKLQSELADRLRFFENKFTEVTLQNHNLMKQVQKFRLVQYFQRYDTFELYTGISSVLTEALWQNWLILSELNLLNLF